MSALPFDAGDPTDLDGMMADARPDRSGLQVLSRDECLTLLASAPIGRVAFTADALPAVQPVNFVVHRDQVVLRTRPGSKLDAAARNTIVAFEADDYDPAEHTGWSVTVIGPASVVSDDGRLAELRALPLRTWAPGRREHFVTISIVIAHGRRIVHPDGHAS